MEYIPLQQALEKGLIVHGELINLILHGSVFIHVLHVTSDGNRFFIMDAVTGKNLNHSPFTISDFVYSIGYNHIVAKG